MYNDIANWFWRAPWLMTSKSSFPSCVKSPGTTLYIDSGWRKEVDFLNVKSSRERLGESAIRVHGREVHHDSKGTLRASADRSLTTRRLGFIRESKSFSPAINIKDSQLVCIKVSKRDYTPIIVKSHRSSSHERVSSKPLRWEGP